MTRFYITYFTMQFHFRFGFDFKFWLPGIEMKFACEAAEKVGSQLHFLGAEINPTTYERLQHETRMNLPQYIFRRAQYFESKWTDELKANRQKIEQAGAKTFTEKCLDQYLINWYIATLEVFFPRVKEIFVDKRDEDLFKAIDESEG